MTFTHADYLCHYSMLVSKKQAAANSHNLVSLLIKICGYKNYSIRIKTSYLIIDILNYGLIK